MGKRRYEQICVRFHLDEERDRNIFQIITNLEDERFKSKNQFILNAIENYIEYINENGTEEKYVPQRKFEALQREVRELKKQLKMEIRTELYEQILSVLTSSTMANLAVVGMRNNVNVDEKAEPTKQEDSYDLGSGDGLLEDVMKWS